MYKFWTEEKEKTLLRDYREGRNLKEIAKSVNRSPQAVSEKLRRLGVPPRRPEKDWSFTETRRLLVGVHSKESLSSLCAAFPGRSRASIKVKKCRLRKEIKCQRQSKTT